MKIAVASGKGGTGKTLIATNLFNVTDNTVFLDCDVEEPNGHLFLQAEHQKNIPVNLLVPQIDEAKCVHCGKCSEVCKFNALIAAKNKVLFFPELCHGCGSCAYFCPHQAITEVPRNIGQIEVANFKNKQALTGRLNVGEPMAPPVIKQLKEQVKNFTQDIIIDAPPGTSCPVIEAVTGVDYVVLVTEATPFGLNDLKLAVELVRKLNIPLGIIVNKSGLGGTIISDYCREENLTLLLELPHDNEIAQKYSRGQLITDDEKYKNIFKKLYEDIRGAR